MVRSEKPTKDSETLGRKGKKGGKGGMRKEGEERGRGKRRRTWRWRWCLAVSMRSMCPWWMGQKDPLKFK